MQTVSPLLNPVSTTVAVWVHGRYRNRMLNLLMVSKAVEFKENTLSWSGKAHRAGVFLVISLGFAIPISTSLTDLLASLVLVLWFFAGHYKTLGTQIRHPLVRAALLLFLIFVLTMIYSSASLGEAGKMLKKYRELVYLLFFIPFLAVEQHRTWAQCAFGLAMVLTLIVSFYTFYFPTEGLPLSLSGHAFKYRVDHSFLMAAFLFGLMTYVVAFKNNKRYVVGLSILCLLAAINLFFMVSGRTGYILFFLLFIVFLAQQFKWRYAFYGLLLLLVLNFGLIAVSGVYKQRVNETVENTLEYFKKENSESLDLGENSIGLRLEFMKYGFQLFSERPVFGYGTGSFKSQYERLAEAKGLKHKTAHPHNEFLMTGVQTGLVGVGVLLYFIFCQFKYSLQLNPPYKNLGMGLSVLTFTACMGNSILLDHTSGVFHHLFYGSLFFSLDLSWQV